MAYCKASSSSSARLRDVMPDLDELLAFNRVMETGSLTQSAIQLGLAKSTLSRRISQLEARLGQPLLKRQANQLLPTEAGQRYYVISREILKLADQGQRTLDSLREDVSGELHVEAHRTLTRSWLGGVMETFLEKHPAVRLTLSTGEVAARDPDFQGVCVWLGQVEDGNLRQERLGALERGIYAHPDYLAHHGEPESPDALAHHAWIDLMGESQNGITLTHRQGGQVHFQPPASRFRVDQSMLHVDAIARGRGIGVLPVWMVEARERHHPGELVRCLDHWSLTPLPVTLLYGFGHQPRKVTALLDHLRDAVPTDWIGQRQEPLARRQAAG
ncbi:LysR family transcriptional regulator [Halomonas denitrificans]|uniref:LysR family transcriptional regulator n=1 Tax=Halomonas TaxID=2745 RepID=UPI001CD7E31B|nr:MULTISPECIES: LysR family transcriptional regulator [Halomonas]MCA0974693.1 LysR family transcriptional regulator [Halomonas denitrificans]